MAKKKTKKKSSKTPAPKPATDGAEASPTPASDAPAAPAKKKKTTKKAAAKKAPAKKKPAAKKTTKKAAAKKAPAKKKSASKKTSSKKKTEPAASQPAADAPAKISAKSKKKTSKSSAKSAEASKASGNGTADTKADAKKDSKSDSKDAKSSRKGITIVEDKGKKKRRPSASSRPSGFTPPGPRLLGPGSPVRRPLIPSNPRPDPEDDAANKAKRRKRAAFPKRKLDKFRDRLLEKRRELLGDLTNMESGALRSGGSGSSNTPQHLADQGSDSYDQSLALNLAAADRALIREIDAALQRIDDKTFGYCEVTGEPISEARLEELPWTRLSVEAARMREQGGPR